MRKSGLGPELYAPGTMDDISGWTAFNSTLSIVGGRMRVTITAGYGYAWIGMPTEIGSRYRLVSSAYWGTGFSQRTLSAVAGGGFDVWNDNSTPGTGTTFEFVATATTTFLTCHVNSATIGQYADYDNISLRKVG
jgi:hypothetical protein